MLVNLELSPNLAVKPSLIVLAAGPKLIKPQSIMPRIGPNIKYKEHIARFAS